MEEYNFDVKRVTEECVQWIKRWFDNNGKDCKAVVGISGGKDSSVVAALCVKALGKDRVFGVLMPNGEQSDIDYSRKLVDELGIESCTINIFSACNALKHVIKPALNDHWSEQTSINMPPRVRMTVLYAVAQTINGRVANTCNLSESHVGYATLYGDQAGSFSPLDLLTATEVVAIGRELGLSDELTGKVPTDGLCGKTDEDNLGFSYAELDKYLRTGIIEDLDHKERIDTLYKSNRFKLRLMGIPTYNPGIKIAIEH